MTYSRSFMTFGFVVAIGLLSPGCSDDSHRRPVTTDPVITNPPPTGGGTVTPGGYSSATLNPPKMLLPVNQTATYSIVFTDTEGNQITLPTPRVKYTLENIQGASGTTISDSGEVTAGSDTGTADVKIHADYDDDSNTGANGFEVVEVFSGALEITPDNSGGGGGGGGGTTTPPSQRATSLTLAIPAGTHEPGVPFHLEIGGVRTDGGAVTDAFEVNGWYKIVSGQAVVDREGNVTPLAPNETIKVKFVAIGSTYPTQINGRTIVGEAFVEAEAEFTSGNANLPMALYWDFDGAMMSSGQYERVIVRDQNWVDITSTLDSLVALAQTGQSNADTVILEDRSGEKWSQAQHGGNFELEATLGTETISFKGKVVMGDSDILPFNDTHARVSRPSLNPATGRVRIPFLFNSAYTNTGAIAGATPAFFGPGHNSGMNSWLDGWQNVDPLPGFTAVYDDQGNLWWLYYHEFTTFVNLQLYKMPPFQYLGHYLRPVADQTLWASWDWVANGAHSGLWWVLSNGEANFSVRFSFTPVSSSGLDYKSFKAEAADFPPNP